MIGHGVADDLAGDQVRPAGEVEPALGGGQVGDVADQLDPGTPGVKVAAYQVRGRLRLLVGPGQRAALAPGDAADVALTHYSGDALAVHPLPQTPQPGVDARDTVGAPGGEVGPHLPSPPTVALSGQTPCNAYDRKPNTHCHRRLPAVQPRCSRPAGTGSSNGA